MLAPVCAADPGSSSGQVSYHCRLITPDEYDAAVLTAPRACPLFAMGDLRSGRQLLEDFDADARWTVRRLAESRRGSPALRRMTAALAEKCGRFEDRLRGMGLPAAGAAGGAPLPPAGQPYSAVLVPGRVLAQ